MAMHTKLQELTQKIYDEGINKAKEESEKLFATAHKEAEDIVAKARKQADDILKDANKNAEELKKNTLNELHLTSRQLISFAQQKIVTLIEAKAIEPEVKRAFSDTQFIQEIVMTLVKKWDPTHEQEVNLKVLLPASQQKEFEDFFKKKASDLMQKGLDVIFTDKIKGGFKIGPKNGGYVISLTDEDFDTFFRSFLRPKLIEMLYNKGQ